ncbi:MAG TPA: hypothetical protein VHS28_06215 [Chloroflexota bacterium]|nr:hypothetical protein [Chloroflexota bacterium]
MRCARCGSRFDTGDNYCRRCGVTLDGRGLPTVVTRSLLPVPWSAARGPLIRGVVALAVGTVAEIVRREVARRVVSTDPSQALALLTAGKPVEGRRGLFSRSKTPKGEYEVVETFVQRRLSFRKK